MVCCLDAKGDAPMQFLLSSGPETGRLKTFAGLIKSEVHGGLQVLFDYVRRVFAYVAYPTLHEHSDGFVKKKTFAHVFLLYTSFSVFFDISPWIRIGVAPKSKLKSL